jgi:hypothetical protein
MLHSRCLVVSGGIHVLCPARRSEGEAGVAVVDDVVGSSERYQDGPQGGEAP